MVPWRAPDVARRLPRVLVGIVLSLPVLLVGGVLLASVVFVRDPVPDTDTVRLTVRAVPTPAAASADCSRLLSGLPGEIRTDTGMLPQRILADPAPAATVAWGGEDGATPIVLRCGLPRPPEGANGPLRDVVGVDWVAVAGDTPGSTTWVTVDRAVHIGLTVPDVFGEAPLLDVSRGVKIALVSR